MWCHYEVRYTMHTSCLTSVILHIDYPSIWSISWYPLIRGYHPSDGYHLVRWYPLRLLISTEWSIWQSWWYDRYRSYHSTARIAIQSICYRADMSEALVHRTIASCMSATCRMAHYTVRHAVQCTALHTAMLYGAVCHDSYGICHSTLWNSVLALASYRATYVFRSW